MIHYRTQRVDFTNYQGSLTSLNIHIYKARVRRLSKAVWGQFSFGVIDDVVVMHFIKHNNAYDNASLPLYNAASDLSLFPLYILI